MLVIRFFRVGKKNQPSFKIVVTDKRKSSTAGRSTEEVGFYNPLTKEKNLKQERIKYWMSVGAKPSATVYNLLVSEKIIEGKKILKQKKSKKEAKKPSESIAPAAAQPIQSEKTALIETAPIKEEKEISPKEEKEASAKEGKETPAPEEKKETPPVETKEK
jgi:small subunit ribosomal protein S16